MTRHLGTKVGLDRRASVKKKNNMFWFSIGQNTVYKASPCLPLSGAGTVRAQKPRSREVKRMGRADSSATVAT